MIALPVLSGQDCPRFDSCNAAVCPLDRHWPEAAHLPGEKTCYYLLASGKAGAVERFAADPVFAAVLDEASAVRARHPRIDRTVQQAVNSGFQGDHLRRQARAEGQKTWTDIAETAVQGVPSRSDAITPTTDPLLQAAICVRRFLRQSGAKPTSRGGLARSFKQMRLMVLDEFVRAGGERLPNDVDIRDAYRKACRVVR